jgi:FkbM family methyltransferase
MAVRTPIRNAYAFGLRALHSRGVRFESGGRELGLFFHTINQYRSIRRFRHFEPEFLDAFEAEVARAKVVFDVGSYIGLYSVTALCCGDDVEVHAFEPEPVNFGIVQRNLEQTGGRGAVHQMCLGDENGSLKLNIKGNSGHFVRRGDTEAGQSIEVPVRTLDALVEEGLVPAPDLIKIDVEGFEASVLRGMSGVLETVRPLILMELHPGFLERYGESAQGLDAYMRDLGYRQTLLRAPGVGQETTHKQLHVAYRPEGAVTVDA